MKALLIFISSFCICILPNATYAWGVKGHRVIAQIAQRNLTLAAQKKIGKLFEKENLTDVSTWADEIRSSKKKKYKKYLPWHYATIPNGKSYDELPVRQEGDVYQAITSIIDEVKRTPFEKFFGSKKLKRHLKTQIKLLVHFIADIHQPLHVGNGLDKGANLCLVKYFGKFTSLHAVLDTLLVDRMNYSYTELANHLERTKKLKNKSMDVKAWLNESNKLRPSLYPTSVDGKKRSYCRSSFDEYNSAKESKLFLKKVPVLSYDYDFQHKSLVKKQLFLGGQRLALVLNTLFSK